MGITLTEQGYPLLDDQMAQIFKYITRVENQIAEEEQRNMVNQMNGGMG